MTENTNTPTSELDLDDWLAGGQRNTQLVVLFARNGLFADIQALERQLTPAPQVAEGDESLGGEHDPNIELRAEIDRLEQELYASKKEFRVAGRTTEESKAIEQQIREDLKAEIDAAAAKGRAEAKKTADRLGVKAVDEVNEIIRSGALEFISRLVTFEHSIRSIAASTTVKVGDEWVPVTAEQVRKMYKTIGEAQVDLLAQAALKSANDTPKVTVPKS